MSNDNIRMLHWGAFHDYRASMGANRWADVVSRRWWLPADVHVRDVSAVRGLAAEQAAAGRAGRIPAGTRAQGNTGWRSASRTLHSRAPWRASACAAAFNALPHVGTAASSQLFGFAALSQFLLACAARQSWPLPRWDLSLYSQHSYPTFKVKDVIRALHLIALSESWAFASVDMNRRWQRLAPLRRSVYFEFVPLALRPLVI